jgi:hypothetical protein
MRTIGTKRIEQLLRVKCLLAKLRTHGRNHDWMTMTDVEDTKPSETVDVDLAANSKELGATGFAAITPLDSSVLVTD